MYRSDLQTRDRGGAIAAVVAVHAGLLFVLLHMSGATPIADVQSALKVFETTQVPPPQPLPPPPVQHKHRTQPKLKPESSAPAAPKSRATPIKQVRPPVSLPVPVSLTTSSTPNAGTAPTQGAAAAGAGTGAGGAGNGTGSGSGSNGSGSGGDGGVMEPPHLATPVLNGRDFPMAALADWPRGATVFLRLRVDPRGYVSECAVDRGAGMASIDSIICDLARQRLRFRPALNRAGQPVAGWFGYAQPSPR